MGRTRGARNSDYDEKREQLARAAAQRLIAEDGAAASARELARAAGVSLPTLVHYFGDRDGVVLAAFESMMRRGERYVSAVADAPQEDAAQSLEWFLGYFLQGWRRFGVGDMLGRAMAVAMGSATRGEGYVRYLLEPTLQALETRLAAHHARGQLDVPSPRFAAIALLGPVIVALLHQDQLFGSSCRPLNVDDFLGDHLARFLRAHAVAQAGE